MSRLLYSIREAWRGLWVHRALTLNSLLALVGALAIPAVFLVVLVNALESVRVVGDRREMIVFLRDDAPDSTVRDLTARLDTTARSVVYVSKEEAWEELERELGGGELLEAVGENPLPPSLRVRLRPEHLHFEAMDSLASSLAEHEAVEEIRFGAEAVRVMDRVVTTLRWTGIGVAGVIALVVLFVVANTIRLTIEARREIHHAMRLVGASAAFVQLPLVIEGMIVSAMAGVLALAAVYGIYRVLAPQLAVLPSFLPWTWGVAFLAAATLLGGFGGLAALAAPGSREEDR